MSARNRLSTLPLAICVLLLASPGKAEPSRWSAEWPDTDFSKSAVDFDEIMSGGPPKDGIPSIDDPRFGPVDDANDIPGHEPLISVEVSGEARGYPLRILMWHEIVNDRVGGVPLAITYCPLCNTGIVFMREHDGRLLEFGTTGKLRKSDLVMYDRQTESWWQQFNGRTIVGELTGARLEPWPSRLESLDSFVERRPDGQILLPPEWAVRDYGRNPYVGYDSRSTPYGFFDGQMPEGIPPLARVVRVDDKAWSLSLLREKGRIEAGDLVLTWRPGQASALDQQSIADGADVGNVVVQRRTDEGLVDAVYSVDFAFAFNAFYPESDIVTQ